jgi:hypothetical protein
MLHCNKKSAALQFFYVRVVTMAMAKRLRNQAARCAALAKQTHDDEARQRYLRLEQTYLQMAQAEDQADSSSSVGGKNLKPAAA